MGLSVLWVARKETVSEVVPQAERAQVCQPGVIYGELLPGVALVGAVCDLAWSRTSSEVLSGNAGVGGDLVDFSSSPLLMLVGRR